MALKDNFIRSESASNLSEMVMEYIRLAWTSCQYRGETGGEKFRSTPRASAEVADDTLKQGDVLRKMSKRAEKIAGRDSMVAALSSEFHV